DAGGFSLQLDVGTGQDVAVAGPRATLLGWADQGEHGRVLRGGLFDAVLVHERPGLDDARLLGFTGLDVAELGSRPLQARGGFVKTEVGVLAHPAEDRGELAPPNGGAGRHALPPPALLLCGADGSSRNEKTDI